MYTQPTNMETKIYKQKTSKENNCPKRAAWDKNIIEFVLCSTVGHGAYSKCD